MRFSSRSAVLHKVRIDCESRIGEPEWRASILIGRHLQAGSPCSVGRLDDSRTAVGRSRDIWRAAGGPMVGIRAGRRPSGRPSGSLASQAGRDGRKTAVRQPSTRPRVQPSLLNLHSPTLKQQNQRTRVRPRHAMGEPARAT
jgi:hypothetical protein